MKTSKTLILLGLVATLIALPGCRKKVSDEGAGAAPPSEPVDADKDFADKGPVKAGGEDREGVDESGLSALGREFQGKLHPVFFAFDKYNLTPESRETLTANAKAMRDPQYSRFFVVVEGHCDERGTNEYNIALGDRRARAARDFVLAQGVDSGRMGTISYGEEKPFEMGHDEFSWAQNRRAHFTVKER